jgi:hypothetical protein
MSRVPENRRATARFPTLTAILARTTIEAPSTKHFMSQTRNITFTERLKEIDSFFQGTDRVHQTMHRVADRLEAANISYAIAGGMAVNAHRHERTTKDVDFLVNQAGFTEFKRRFVPQ